MMIKRYKLRQVTFDGCGMIVEIERFRTNIALRISSDVT